MFLKQWDQTLAYGMSGVAANITDVTGESKTQGSWRVNALSQTVLNTIPLRAYIDGGVAFGTGNVAPVYADYKFSGDVIDIKNAGLTVSADVAVTRDGDSVVATAVYSIINNGTAAVTIGEIGIATAVTGSTTSTTGSGFALLEKTALDVPITIPVGDTGKITYTIRADIPTA